MKPKIYILCGPPCSGKSTYAARQGLPVISCDNIRMEYVTDSVYKFNPKVEEKVWEEFYQRLKLYQVSDFIIDNTNCKNAYIDKIIQELNPGYEIYIKKFNTPLWKLYYRNIIRWFKTGKWIPFKVIKNMKNNFNKLKYKNGEYILNQ